jgi:hypothetical protein
LQTIFHSISDKGFDYRLPVYRFLRKPQWQVAYFQAQGIG